MTNPVCLLCHPLDKTFFHNGTLYFAIASAFGSSPCCLLPFANNKLIKCVSQPLLLPSSVLADGFHLPNNEK